MSEAGTDWAHRGAAAELDPALKAFAAGGALLLWDAQRQRIAFADLAGRALLGAEPAQAALPAPTTRRLAALAEGLASAAGIRLERLRLTPSFAGLALTCGCKMVSAAGVPSTLAIAIPSSELRRLGVKVPAAPALAPAQGLVAPAQVSEPAAPLPPSARFVWQSDAEGRLTRLSEPVSLLSGEGAAARLLGRRWRDLEGEVFIDRDGGLAARFEQAATWSGHTVLWRLPTAGEAAPVDLSAVPVFDAERNLAGFRGFGLARLGERAPLPLDAPPVVEDARPSAAAPQPAATTLSEPEQEPILTGAPTPDEEAEGAPAMAAEPAQEVPPSTQPGGDLEEQDDAPLGPLDEPAEAVTTAGRGDEEVADGSEPEGLPAAIEDASAPPPIEREPGNIVPLRQGQIALRPVLEPSKTNLSSAERNAFREIAKALGARLADEGEVAEPRLPPVAPLRVKEREEGAAAEADAPPAAVPVTAAPPAAVPTRHRNVHADLLDRLPIAVLVNRGEEALYANRTLLDLLDYADLDDLRSAGGVSRLIKDAARSGGGAMTLIDRLNHLVSVEAAISSIDWQDEPASLMAFRHPDGGGEVPVLTPEEAEEAELAAEFEAEEAEAAARVEALRLDAEVRDERIAELTAMLDTATDGVVTVDDRGRILSLNKAAEALFGYDQREVTGELLTLLFANESHAPALDYLEGLKGGGVASVLNDGREVFGRVRQGGKIPLFMTMGQIAHGGEPRFCAVLRDITAWKKTEGELVDARKAAELASAQKSDVLAKISHEIRTPLNAIIGFAEVMAEERFGPIGNERYKEYLRDIHQSGGYVISLVNDLLDLAKIEAGKLDLDFVSVNLNDIALSTVALLQPEAQRGKVVLRSGLSPKLPPVVADERSIRQIAINLLSNAVKFTDAGGQVIISTALGDQGEAILRVRDTGIGMDDNELKLALEPFRQVPTTRRSGGTGLGLPLTKALVEANRAAMSITSVKKEGTLVEITFPPQRVLAS